MARKKGRKQGTGTKTSPARKAAAVKADAGKVAKPREKPARSKKVVEPKVTQSDLDSVRESVEAAKGGLEKALAEAEAMAEKARAIVAQAKDAYPNFRSWSTLAAIFERNVAGSDCRCASRSRNGRVVPTYPLEVCPGAAA